MTTTLLITAALAAGTPTSVHTSIKGSIEASLVRVVRGDGPALAAQVARLLRWRGDVVRNVQPRDELRLLYESNPEPQLLAIAYRGSEIQLTAYRFDDSGGVPRFYDENGTLVEPFIVANPVPDYVQITEVPQRGSGKRRHKGLDLKAPEGTSVSLPFDAVVTRVNWATRANGNCIEVAYGDGTLARFLHLSEVDPLVKTRSRLKAGVRLGAVGSTGRSSAPHLHYEIRGRNGSVINPLERHGTTTAKLPAKQKSSFERQRAKYDLALRGDSTGTASVR